MKALISNKLLLKELQKRAERKHLELEPNFEAQNAFVQDPARFLIAQCSRRAGKTNGLAIRFFKTLEKYPKAQCIYLSLTLDSARDIMWPVLQELNEKFNIGCSFTESNLTMRHPNGSQLKLYGADMKNFIKRLKGRKFPGVAIDEAQDFGTHLQTLIDDVLTPALSDYADSWLALTGTPGPVPQGYFFDVSQNKKFGYSFHEWTLIDNPFMPNPAGFIEQLKKDRQWDDNNPTLLREWRNKWVLDVESLWVRYNESVNHYIQLPTQKYTYIMGIDLGFNDADALAVMAWSESDPTTYLVEEVIKRKQGLTELVQDIQAMCKKYDISKMIIDEGGLGKKLAEEMRRRHHIPVHPAEKQRKQETVEFLNDALRLGKVKAKADSQFAKDSYLIQIDWDRTTPDKIVIKKSPHSDIIDAVIYAFKESPAYTYQKPVAKAPKGTPAYFDEEVSDMEKAAEEHFTALEEAAKGYNPYE